ncbi:MAG: NADAR domain-containing protein [Caldimonas sp.]
MRPEQTRIYDRGSSVVFRKTDEPFGGLSNMAGGFPLRVNGIRILTLEALYQACRFPHLPEVQSLIIEQRSPMTAKMKSKPYRHDSRPDWDQVRVKIMRWSLRVKLAQNWQAFSELLLETGERPIVEESRRDDFWGAKATDDSTLVGMNVLGRLLMELRQAVKDNSRESLMRVQPPHISNFLLAGGLIGTIAAENVELEVAAVKAVAKRSRRDIADRTVAPPSLFDGLTVREGSSPTLLCANAAGACIAELKPYAEYKESGLPWLGQVPGHWAVRPAFGAFQPNHERNHGMKERTVLSLSYGRIVVKPTEKLHGLVPESFETYQVVNPGDIVLRTVDLQNDHTSLRVGMVRNRGIITSAYLALRATADVSADFGFQFLTVWDASKAIYGYGSGLRQNLDFSHFKRMPVSVPPLAEQAAIVRFLGWANGRLERAIRAKRKVIALLGEQEQAIIHRAVTRGLDPSVPLRPSGIAWLGDIPQHWEVKRSKYVYREVDVRSTTGEETHLSMSQKLGLIPSSKIEVRRLVSDSYVGAKLCECGDLVLNRLKAHLGVFALANEPGLVSPDYTVLRPVRELDARFFEAVYRTPACRVELRQRAKGIVQGFWRLYTDDFYDISVPVPRVEEQTQIMAQLDIDLFGVHTATSRLEREIELLREYRTRLVADVVTGKLDVREAALLLPDEAEERGALDEPESSTETGDDTADDLDLTRDEAEA